MVNGKQQGRHGGGEDAAYHHGQRGKGALGDALLGGGGGADGVGAGAHGQPLGFGVGDPHQPEQGEADQGADDPDHHHHGGGDGGNAAQRLTDAHGERGGDGFGGERGQQCRIGPHKMTDNQGSADRDQDRAQGTDQDGFEPGLDLAGLLIEGQRQRHHRRLQQGRDGAGAALVLLQRQIEPEQQADDDGGGHQHRVDDGPGQLAIEGPGGEIERQGQGNGQPEDHLFILW